MEDEHEMILKVEGTEMVKAERSRGIRSNCGMMGYSRWLECGM